MLPLNDSSAPRISVIIVGINSCRFAIHLSCYTYSVYEVKSICLVFGQRDYCNNLLGEIVVKVLICILWKLVDKVFREESYFHLCLIVNLGM